jgi:hypothetical protein
MFEITFKYKDQAEPGIYSEGEKSKIVKVGLPCEDTPLEKVAVKIFAQLAKRSILITDVEIYEFIKKKLSYKEVVDGIVIKNKKFKFDDEINVSETIETEEKPQDDVARLLSALAANPNLLAVLKGEGAVAPSPSSSPLKVVPPPPPKIDKPIRHEVFDPPKWLLVEAKKRGLKFTVGKKYPILHERMHENPQAGMIYTTIDDEDNRQALAGIHFNPVPVPLERGFEAPAAVDESGLSWGGMVEEQGMPALR